MSTLTTIKKAIQEVVMPELGIIRTENTEIKSILTLTNKRIDDIYIQLSEHSKRIDEFNKRMDELNKRMDEFNKRMDEFNKRIDRLNADFNSRIDETNKRIDHLYAVIVRREEHIHLEERVLKIENQIEEIKRKLVA